MVSTVGGNGGLSRPLAATASAAGGRGRDGGALAGKGPKPCAATTTSTYTISILLPAAAWQPPRSHPQATSYRPLLTPAPSFVDVDWQRIVILVRTASHFGRQTTRN